MSTPSFVPSWPPHMTETDWMLYDMTVGKRPVMEAVLLHYTLQRTWYDQMYDDADHAVCRWAVYPEVRVDERSVSLFVMLRRELHRLIGNAENVREWLEQQYPPPRKPNHCRWDWNLGERYWHVHQVGLLIEFSDFGQHYPILQPGLQAQPTRMDVFRWCVTVAQALWKWSQDLGPDPPRK